ncbi:MAG: hypothetical protein D6735_12210 [Acidobacteria bacterium]|nr:MAG: hypothetical protein D6735_12210 [Acidobacteriota bacterium]
MLHFLSKPTIFYLSAKKFIIKRFVIKLINLNFIITRSLFNKTVYNSSMSSSKILSKILIFSFVVFTTGCTVTERISRLYSSAIGTMLTLIAALAIIAIIVIGAQIIYAAFTEQQGVIMRRVPLLVAIAAGLLLSLWARDIVGSVIVSSDTVVNPSLPPIPGISGGGK